MPEAIHLATLRSVMGKDCLQIFLNLMLTEEESTSVNANQCGNQAGTRLFSEENSPLKICYRGDYPGLSATDGKLGRTLL